MEQNLPAMVQQLLLQPQEIGLPSNGLPEMAKVSSKHPLMTDSTVGHPSTIVECFIPLRHH